jgi:hypothetical protein
MATFIGKGKLFIGDGDEFVPIAVPDYVDALAEWPTVGEITISGKIEMTPEDRRNLLVYWIMLLSACAAQQPCTMERWAGRADV